jgi:hypothetical protein
MSEKDKVISQYLCGDCGSEEWHLVIERLGDGETHLLTMCANEQCRQDKLKSLNGNEGDVVIWDDFDITNQGYDDYEDNEPIIVPKKTILN